MQIQAFPKDLTPERIEALLSFLPAQDGWRAERRAMLSRFEELPSALKYGLQIVAEYPRIAELFGAKTPAKHDFRMEGKVTLHPFDKASAVGGRVWPLLASRAETSYDAALSSLFTESAYVRAEGEGSLLLATASVGVHAELIVIHALPGATLSVTERIAGTDSGVFGRTIVVIAEKGARVSYRSAVADPLGGSLFVRRYGIADEGAVLSVFEVAEGGQERNLRTDIALEGANAEGTIVSALAAGEGMLTDIDHRIRHMAPDTRSRIAAAGVARKKSRTIYRAHLEMERGALKATGRQEGKFIVADGAAKVDAIPSLDIRENDVRCAHAMSVSYLSPKDLYYPSLRGISREEAAGFVASGMMKNVFSRAGAPERDAYEMSRLGEIIDRV